MSPAPKKRLLDCDVGDIAHTPAGHLMVSGDPISGGWAWVRLWHPYERRTVSHPFCVDGEMAVLSVSREQR